MTPYDIYKFCPKCAGSLEQKPELALHCTNCNYSLHINPVAAAAAIIENRQNEILLTKRATEPRKDTWDLPGGFMMPHETLEESTKREVKEELGMNIEIEQIVGVFPNQYLYKEVEIPTMDIYVKAKVTNSEGTLDEHEVSEFKYFPKNEILKLELSFSSTRLVLEYYLSQYPLAGKGSIHT